MLKPVDILALREQVNDVFIDEKIERYAVEVVTATRNLSKYLPQWGEMIQTGASPRASIALLRSAMARAFLDDRDYVIPEDIIELAGDVLRHRIVLDFSAQAEDINADTIISSLLNTISRP